MLSMLKTYISFRHPREEGATAVEYGIMVALIAVVIIIAVATLGENLSSLFGEVAETVGDAGDGVDTSQ